jgi:DNA-binding GntR family transcriptional regulator
VDAGLHRKRSIGALTRTHPPAMARKSPLTAPSQDGLSGATRASAVYEQLRADITQGVLEPGSKLRVGATCERYAVGASPLREALSRLSAEGLVSRTDQRGFSVAALSWQDLPILTRNRVQLESLALAESIEQRDAAWEDQLTLLVHRLSRTPRSLATDHYLPNPEWETLHREFHRSLLARCPSRWLRAFCDSLADEAYRFRQLAAVRVFSSRNEHAEHVSIFDAATHGRTDEAVRLLGEHYTRTAGVVAQQARDRERPA